MIQKFRNKLLKRTIALGVIVTLFVVGVIGDHYIDGENAKEERKAKIAMKEAESLDFDYSMLHMNELKSPDEMELAVSDTEMGKISDELQEAYRSLKMACENNVKGYKEAGEIFNDKVISLKNRATKLLSDNNFVNENGLDYKKDINDNFKLLEEYSSKLCKDNCYNVSETVTKIGELVDPEVEEMSLSNDLSFSNIASDDIESETVSEDDTEDVSHDYEEEVVLPEDTQFTNDTVINDKIKEEFSAYNSVLEVYQYIKNNYQMQFYYGSRKGAVGTFEQKSGNDYDIASLLIGVLRDRGIPAKYARSEVEITAEQAIEWTGAKNIEAAAKVMAAQGIPGTTVAGGEGIESIRFEHVWVLVYVPYTDYRGTGKQAGEKMWIPLDPSFNKVEFVKHVDIEKIDDYLHDESNKTAEGTLINGYSLDEFAPFFDNTEASCLFNYIVENHYENDNVVECFGGFKIVSEDLGYLPLSTPFKVKNEIETFDDIEDKCTQSITVSLGTNSKILEALGQEPDFSKKLYAPDIYGKRITIAYDPATGDDAQIIKKYGGLFKAPAYLIKFIPRLYVDGVVVAEGTAVTAGTIQKYNIKVDNVTKKIPNGNVGNMITAGEMYSVVLDYGHVSSDCMEELSSTAEEFKKYSESEDMYKESALGKCLYAIGQSYFAHLDGYNVFVSGQREVVQTRALSAGVVGFSTVGANMFGRTSELNEGGLFLDISYDTHSVVSINNNKQNEQEYMLQSGVYGSSMEHEILELFTGVEAVSTIKALGYAVENNIPVHMITDKNCDEEIAKLNVSNSIVNEIRTAVKNGRVVVIPEETLTIGQWVGSGYMVLDTDTYACGYMIKGQVNGNLSGGQICWQNLWDSYVENMKAGFDDFIKFAALFALGNLLLPELMAVLFYVFMAFLIISIIVITITAIYQYFVSDGDPHYLEEALGQLLSIITYLLIGKAIDGLYKWAKGKTGEGPKVEGPGEEPGGCFIAGTFVYTNEGLKPIERIKVGDEVYSFDSITMNVAIKRVQKTYVRKANKLVHIYVGNEEIVATPNHPFYVKDKKFVEAGKLRAGDCLCTVNGDYVIVEKIQHEILEEPINVYNLNVKDYHTYFVGDTCIGVHNSCAQEPGEGPKVEEPGEGPKVEEPDNGLEFDKSKLTRSQSKAVESAENNINDHLTEQDISGAKQELEGNLIEKGNGEYWNHINEVKDAYRGISRAKNTLEGSLKNPNLEPDVRSFIQSEVDKISNYMNIIETMFEPYGGIE